MTAGVTVNRGSYWGRDGLSWNHRWNFEEAPFFVSLSDHNWGFTTLQAAMIAGSPFGSAIVARAGCEVPSISGVMQSAPGPFSDFAAPFTNPTPAQPRVFCLADQAHASAAWLLEDEVVRNVFSVHGATVRARTLDRSQR